METCSVHKNEEARQALALVATAGGELRCPWCHPEAFGGDEAARKLYAIVCTEHDAAFEENEHTRGMRCPRCPLMCYQAKWSPATCDKRAVFAISDPDNARQVPTLACEDHWAREVSPGSSYLLEHVWYQPDEEA